MISPAVNKENSDKSLKSASTTARDDNYTERSQKGENLDSSTQQIKNDKLNSDLVDPAIATKNAFEPPAGPAQPQKSSSPITTQSTSSTPSSSGGGNTINSNEGGLITKSSSSISTIETSTTTTTAKTTTSMGRFKEKRPEPLKLNSNLNQDIPLDLSVKSAGNVPSGAMGNIFNLSFGVNQMMTTLETPRIIWQDNENLLTSSNKHSRLYSSSNSTSQRLRLSSIVGDSPPITPSTPFLDHLMMITSSTSIGSPTFRHYNLSSNNHHHHHHHSQHSIQQPHSASGYLNLGEQNQDSQSSTTLQALLSAHQRHLNNQWQHHQQADTNSNHESSGSKSKLAPGDHSPAARGSSSSSRSHYSPNLFAAYLKSARTAANQNKSNNFGLSKNNNTSQAFELSSPLSGCTNAALTATTLCSNDNFSPLDLYKTSPNPPRRSCSTDDLTNSINLYSSNAAATKFGNYSYYNQLHKQQLQQHQLRNSAGSGNSATKKNQSISPLATKNLSSSTNLNTNNKESQVSTNLSHSNSNSNSNSSSNGSNTANLRFSYSGQQIASAESEKNATTNNSPSANTYVVGPKQATNLSPIINVSGESNQSSSGDSSNQYCCQVSPTPSSAVANATVNLLNIHLNSPKNNNSISSNNSSTNPMFSGSEQNDQNLDPLLSHYNQQQQQQKGNPFSLNHYQHLYHQQQGFINNNLSSSTTLNTPTLISPSQLKTGSICFLPSPTLSPISSVFELPSPLLMFPPPPTTSSSSSINNSSQQQQQFSDNNNNNLTAQRLFSSSYNNGTTNNSSKLPLGNSLSPLAGLPSASSSNNKFQSEPSIFANASSCLSSSSSKKVALDSQSLTATMTANGAQSSLQTNDLMNKPNRATSDIALNNNSNNNNQRENVPMKQNLSENSLIHLITSAKDKMLACSGAGAGLQNEDEDEDEDDKLEFKMDIDSQDNVENVQMMDCLEQRQQQQQQQQLQTKQLDSVALPVRPATVLPQILVSEQPALPDGSLLSNQQEQQSQYREFCAGGAQNYYNNQLKLSDSNEAAHSSYNSLAPTGQQRLLSGRQKDNGLEVGGSSNNKRAMSQQSFNKSKIDFVENERLESSSAPPDVYQTRIRLKLKSAVGNDQHLCSSSYHQLPQQAAPQLAREQQQQQHEMQNQHQGHRQPLENCHPYPSAGMVGSQQQQPHQLPAVTMTQRPATQNDYHHFQAQQQQPVLSQPYHQQQQQAQSQQQQYYQQAPSLHLSVHHYNNKTNGPYPSHPVLTQENQRWLSHGPQQQQGSPINSGYMLSAGQQRAFDHNNSSNNNPLSGQDLQQQHFHWQQQQQQQQQEHYGQQQHRQICGYNLTQSQQTHPSQTALANLGPQLQSNNGPPVNRNRAFSTQEPAITQFRVANNLSNEEEARSANIHLQQPPNIQTSVSACELHKLAHSTSSSAAASSIVIVNRGPAPSTKTAPMAANDRNNNNCNFTPAQQQLNANPFPSGLAPLNQLIDQQQAQRPSMLLHGGGTDAASSQPAQSATMHHNKARFLSAAHPATTSALVEAQTQRAHSADRMLTNANQKEYLTQNRLIDHNNNNSNNNNNNNNNNNSNSNNNNNNINNNNNNLTSEQFAFRSASVCAGVVSNGNAYGGRHLTGANNVSKSASNGAGAAKKYHCDQCTKAFTRSDMLTRHKRLHSGDRPFQCNECKQEFSRSDHLSTHMRTHTGEKPYKCKLCTYSACRKDMITRHMKVHNRGSPNNNANNNNQNNSSSNSPRARMQIK